LEFWGENVAFSLSNKWLSPHIKRQAQYKFTCEITSCYGFVW